MFADQLVYGEGNLRLVASYKDAMFSDGGAAVSFVGYLLLLLAALGSCALVLFKTKFGKILALALAGIFLLGAIFVFIEASVYNGKYGDFRLMAGPVFAGIFGILSALLVCASEFLPRK